MTFNCLRKMDPEQVCAAVSRTPAPYVKNWRDWLQTDPARPNPTLLGQILRRWQSTRPWSMRRIRAEAHHPPPFLEDLVADAAPHLQALGDVSVRDLPDRMSDARRHLQDLWRTFEQLTVQGKASCVGISKAVLLLTRGRIGPAFDSRVRLALFGSLKKIESADEWVSALAEVGADIRAFESAHGLSLGAAVPDDYSSWECGRLYDMAFGPR